jgi:cytochrome P450
MSTTEAGVRYDPFDVEIDKDPYPVWRRLREEAPLYYNPEHDFFALSRYDDVQRGLVDWRTFSSAKGTLLELIRSGIELPPGSIIFEDPPEHDLHRGLLSRVFTPRRVGALEPKVREFCVRSLDPLVGTGGFDFIADLGAQMPMRTIGMLLGIPEADQEALRDLIDDSLRIDDGPTLPNDPRVEAQLAATADYIDWRIEHPSDDLITELLHAEYDGLDGRPTRLTRDELVGYVNLIAAAGNETTTRLIGWAGKVLAEHPDQRRMLVDDPTLIPKAVEELLRYESPAPMMGRYVTKDTEHHGEVVPAGSVMLLLIGSANRDDRKFPDGDSFDIRRSLDQHVAFGYGIHFCLGAALARLEGRIALEEVLKRFPEWEVDWDHAVQAHTSTVRGWERLPVVVSQGDRAGPSSGAASP